MLPRSLKKGRYMGGGHHPCLYHIYVYIYIYVYVYVYTDAMQATIFSYAISLQKGQDALFEILLPRSASSDRPCLGVIKGDSAAMMDVGSPD